MSTAITTSAPIWRATSIGRLATSPPSSSRLPSISTGVNAPGTDMLARIARDRLPRSSTTFSPVTRSVATARNGIGRSSKRSIPADGSVSACIRMVTFWPVISPGGSAGFPFSIPIRTGDSTRASSCLRRKERYWRRELSLKTSNQSVVSTTSCSSSTDSPLA